jgi:mortality factor 4-like protein 1
MACPLREKDKDKVQNMVANHVRNNSWDDWVPQDRVRKFTPENKELAAQLHNQMKLLQQKAPKSVGKGSGKRGANGSDFSSARDSEERGGSVAAAPGRGGPIGTMI